MKISTGKDLIKSGVTKFNCDGLLYKLAIHNNQPHLYVYNSENELVNVYPITNKKELNMDIEPLESGALEIKSSFFSRDMVYIDEIPFYCNYNGDCMADSEKCKHCSNYVCSYVDVLEKVRT